MAKKIMVVDDEEMIHKSLTRLLSTEGYQILDAYNGVECLTLAETEKPDLILLDINMPKMDGNETLKELKSKKHTFAIPVIMVTGNGELVDKVVGYELGVEDYITKPFDVSLIKKRIQEIVL